jgi:hypothetical protein
VTLPFPSSEPQVGRDRGEPDPRTSQVRGDQAAPKRPALTAEIADLEPREAPAARIQNGVPHPVERPVAGDHLEAQCGGEPAKPPPWAAFLHQHEVGTIRGESLGRGLDPRPEGLGVEARYPKPLGHG